jgi:hypothetical protein|tara:strand:+ start:850 stop:3186 length:2337 start_codon:yes stop_codon:yes gene_type:complete
MIKSYVKIKPIKDDGAFGANFNEVRKGINRTGVVTENIGNNLVQTHKLIQFEKDWLRDKAEREESDDKGDENESKGAFRRWFKGFKDMFRIQRREESTKDGELDKVEDQGANFGKKTKETVKSGLELLGGFLTPIFKWLVGMAALKWMSDPENAKKAEKVFKLIGAIAKFAWKIGKWGIGLIMAGLTKVFGVFENSGSPIKKGFKFLFGAFQLFAGFKTLQYLLNPLKVISDAKKLTSLFQGNAEKEVEFKKQEQWRKFGYKDRETGKIYTEKEYKAQKKSVERQQKKLRSRGQNAQADKVGAKFNSRVKNPTKLQKGKNFGKQMMKPGMQKGLAVAGGLTRMASGIAMGEDKTTAVGAGLGQAAGGMLGAAAGTALLGPFLGPFAPIVGNAIGSFLGEWIGKTFLPMIKPLFEPIQKAFKMWWTIIKGVADETGITEFLGTFFKFVGQIGKMMFDILGWIMKPLTWVLGGAIKILGGVISFVLKAAKNIFAFMVNPIGFAWKVIRGKDPGKDVKLEEMSKGGIVKSFSGGGKFDAPAGQEWGPNTKEIMAQVLPSLQYFMQEQNAAVDANPDAYGGIKLQMDRDGTMPNFGQFIANMSEWAFNEGVKQIQENEAMDVEVKAALLKKLAWVRKETLENPNFLPDMAFRINKDIPGTAANRLLIKASKDKTSPAALAGIPAEQRALLKSRLGKMRGGLVHMSGGGEFREGRLTDDQIIRMIDKQLKMHEQFKYKNQRDNDIDNVAAIVITKQVTTPVINTKSSGQLIPVVASPSPMFTC